MSVTVLVRQRAQPGQATAFLAEALRILATVPAASSLRGARLFQGLEDPEDFLWLADWDSAEAELPDPEQVEFTDGLDRWAAGPAELAYLRSRSWYADMSRRTAVGQVVLLDFPTGEGAGWDVLRSREAHTLIREQPGLTARTVYEDAANPQRMIVLNGWASVDAWDQFRADTMPRIRAIHHARGGEITYFVGRTQGEYERPRRRRGP
jgi:quinol monooxygenase YgiN